MLKTFKADEANKAVAAYNISNEEAYARAKMLADAKSSKKRVNDTDYAKSAEKTAKKEELLAAAAAITATDTYADYTASIEKAAAKADLRAAASMVQAKEDDAAYVASREKPELLAIASEFEAKDVEAAYTASMEKAAAKADIRAAASMVQAKEDDAAYVASREKPELLAIASEVEAKDAEAIYSESAEKAAAKADMLKTAKALELEENATAYDKSELDAYAKAKMLEDAKEESKKPVSDTDYAAAAKKAAEKDDLIAAAAAINAAGSYADYTSSTEKAIGKEDLLKTAKALAKDKTVSSYDISNDAAIAKAKMLEAASEEQLNKHLNAYDKAAQKLQDREAMLKEADILQRKEEMESYEKHTEISTEEAKLLEIAKRLMEEDHSKAYSDKVGRTEDLKRFISDEEKRERERELEKYVEYAKKLADKEEKVEHKQSKRHKRAIVDYKEKIEKENERLKAENLVRHREDDRKIIDYIKHLTEKNEKEEILAAAKLAETDAKNEAYDAYRAKTDPKATMLADGETEKKISEPDTTALEKKAEKTALKKEGKYIAAADSYAAYAKSKGKSAEEEKLLMLARKLEAQTNASAYATSMEKTESKSALLSEAKSISSMDKLSEFQAYSEKQKTKAEIKKATRYISAIDTKEAYDSHSEKVAKTDNLLKKAKELDEKTQTAAYESRAAKIESKEQLKTAASVMSNTVDTKAYDIAIAKEKRAQQYKLSASSNANAYSIAAINEANKTLTKSEKRAEIIATAERISDDIAGKIYDKHEEKKQETKVDKDVKNEIIKEYTARKTIDAYNRELTKKLPTAPENSRELEEMKSALIRDAKSDDDRKAVRNLSLKEFKDHLKNEERDEANLIREIKRARKEFEEGTRSVKKNSLRDSVELTADLLEKYVENYKTALALRHAPSIKTYEKKANRALAEYITELDLWAQTTNLPAPNVSRTLISDIKEGKRVGPIPRIDKEIKVSEKKARKMLEKDLTKFLKENEKYEIRAMEIEDAGKDMNAYDGEEIIIAKYHMKTDLDTVKSKIEYRKQRYIQEFKRFRYTYGEETLHSEKKHIAQAKKLKKMKKQTGKFIRYTKKNNDRYFKLANLRDSEINVKSDVKRDRVETLLRRIKNLLMERDEVNMKLLNLYADENANPEKKNNTQRKRIDKVKLRATRRVFKKQKFLYKEARSFRVPQAQKDRIYEIMNRKIALKAYLAECKYRKRHESGNAKARRAIKKAIRDTKQKIKYCDHDFDVFMTKASRRSRRTPDKRVQFIWTLLLVAMICAGTFGYVYFMSHKAEILEMLGQYISKLGEFTSGLTDK